MTLLSKAHSNRAWNRAFTLIELLIVVAIIALLISILLPALQAARNEGTKTVCLSSIKEILKGNVMYDDDNGGSREIYWYPLKKQDNPPSSNSLAPLYSQADGLCGDPNNGRVAPWDFGGYRSSQSDDPEAFDHVVPAQMRPLNKYIDPAASAAPESCTDYSDTIKVYQCPGDRSNKVNLLTDPPALANEAVENTIPSHAALGSSFTLNSRWIMQGYAVEGTPVTFPQTGFDTGWYFAGFNNYKQANQRIARATIGGGAAQFIQWDEVGMYSATQRAAEKPEWSGAGVQRMGWHRKFSQWSAGFADGHAAHGMFDTRQVYGLGGTIWQPNTYRGH
jgi:prepilin-type N-terminal cleavage/methylation domain-containing protein